MRISKKEVKKALDKAKKIEADEDLYSIQKLQEEDSWFKQQAKRLTSVFGRFPVGLKKKQDKRIKKKK